MRPFFTDHDFDFATANVLGGVFHRAADVGEVLSTVDRIRNGKARSWVDEWTATANRLVVEARHAEDAKRSHSAAARYLRAANYFAAASGASSG